MTYKNNIALLKVSLQTRHADVFDVKMTLGQFHEADLNKLGTLCSLPDKVKEL